MKHTVSMITALLLAPLAASAQQTPTLFTAGLVGDGASDDTAAIQALLDSRRALVYLPAPPKHYLISKPPSSTALPGPLDLLVNRGTIEHLNLSQVSLEASEGPARGAVVRNSGKIGSRSFQQVSAVNAAVETEDEPNKK